MMRDKILFLFLLLPVGGRALAQVDSISTTREIGEVVVLARLDDDVSALAPRYSLGHDDFLKLNITDTGSALSHLPGLVLRDYGGAGGMKTVSVRGMGSTHTGVALDGLALSDQLSGSIDMQQFLLSEIVGMQLSIGGGGDLLQPARNLSAGALLALASIPSFSQNSSENARNGLPAPPMLSYASIAMGSWGLWQPSLRFVKSSARQAFAFGASALRAENDYPFTVENGVETHGERRTNNRVSQGVVNASHRWNFAPGWELATTARLSDNDRELPGLVRYYVNDNDEQLRDRSALVQAALAGRPAERLRTKVAARWNWTEQDYRVGTSYMGIRSERYTQREYYATLAFAWQASRELELGYAADFFHNALTSTTADNPQRHRNTVLQALSGRWQNGRLTVLGQLLFCAVEKERQLSPSLSASLRLLSHRDLYLRLAAKRSHRMPTMAEQYYFHIGARVLRPETTRQLNLGLAYSGTVGRVGARISADAFLNQVDDKIVCIPYNMFVWRYANLGRVASLGLDLSAQIDCGIANRNALQLSLNHSLQRVKNQSAAGEYHGLQIAYVPLSSGSATLSWLNPWANLSATAVYASETWATNEHHPETRIASRCELSVGAWREIRLRRGALEASITVQNLLDREYCIVARYPMPGRNVRISTKYKF